MSYIRPSPLPTHYKELDNLKRYRMSDDDPLAPARGAVNGILLGAFAWFVIGAIVYAWWVTR